MRARQTVRIRIEEPAGKVILEGNEIEAKTKVEDKRKAQPRGAAVKSLCSVRAKRLGRFQCFGAL